MKGKHLDGRPITDEEWRDYEIKLANHNNWCDSRLQLANDLILLTQTVGPEEAFARIKKMIEEKRSMDAPNPPGYYRANND